MRLDPEHLSRRARAAVVLVAVLLLVSTACGGSGGRTTATPGEGGAPATVEVRMVDIDFDPATIDVNQGDTVRFVFTNTGRVTHDAFVGSREAQDEHERLMREGHAGDHAEGATDAVTVEAGKTGELSYTFDEPGTIEIGCHQPGHYAIGMKINVLVA